VIAHLSGTLLDKQIQRLVVDVGGVGYAVSVPLSTFYAVGDPGARVALRIHTHVREDSLQLFGFSTALELQLFERLISVNGIGPKVALAVLSGIEPPALVRAIQKSDFGRLTSIPGVGRKTAERIVIELRDRLPKMADAAGDDEPAAPAGDETRDDVLSALGNLGYQRSAAEKAVDKVLRRGGADGFEPVLREVLKELAG
jgi:Holliday junction DNA helicase RuvA